jgi:hypothetical protein
MSWDKPQGDWVVPDYHIYDPVQGKAANCAFIAALSSLAWMGQGLISQQTGEPTTISFYTIDGIETQITVDWYLCMDADGNLVNAHSSEVTELWPAIYEKAYGTWRQGSPFTPFISCNNYETVNWGGNPCTALTHLTNKASVTKINANSSATAILNDIKQKCSFGKIRFPMVAWTYPTAPDGVTYDATVSASHSYSLLGYISSNIILRNPVGVAASTVITNTNWNGIKVGLGYGIFALDYRDFAKKFEAYGFV